MIATYTHDTSADTCEQPPESLTLEQAHAIMQQHHHHCERRKAALALLVQTGRYVLART